jgi:hypothetical protein
VTDAIFVEDSSFVICTSDDGLIRKVNLDSLDIELSIKVCSSALTSITSMGGRYYALAAADGCIYCFNIGYASISQKLEAHSQPIKKVLALVEKVGHADPATRLHALR